MESVQCTCVILAQIIVGHHPAGKLFGANCPGMTVSCTKALLGVCGALNLIWKKKTLFGIGSIAHKNLLIFYFGVHFPYLAMPF